MGRILFILLLVSFGSAQALIFHVPDSVRSIQGAINISEDGDTIIVHPGEYMENISMNNRNVLVTSLIFFDGEEAYIDSTVINGERGNNVVTIRGDTDEAIINGFTLRNGRESGIYMTDSSHAVITNCVITENGAAYGGGIFMLNNCRPTIRNCVITGNSGGFGGGINIWANCSPTIEYCNISGNSSSEGGGIYIRGSAPVIKGCLIAGNTAIFDGAGISCWGSSPEIINCTITGNIADGIGDGLYIWGVSTVTIVNSILWENGNTEIQFGVLDRNRINVSYSDVMGGEDGIEVIRHDEIIWGEGNIDEDPGFIDPENDDFGLDSDSPCIDAGNPESDRDPDFTRADMGALFFPQQNISVMPEVLLFNDRIPEDSLAISIRNIGLRTLHILEQSVMPDDSPLRIGSGGGEVEIEPGETHETWITLSLNKDEVFPEYRTFYEVTSDDRDEREIQIVITDEYNDVETDDNQNIPKEFTITSVYPNPFNSTSKINFKMPSAGHVTVNVFDISGRLVRNIAEQTYGTGHHTLEWKGEGLSGGVYFTHISVGNRSEYVKMILMK